MEDNVDQTEPRVKARGPRTVLVALLVLLPAALAFLFAPDRTGRFFLGFAYAGPLVDEDGWRSWVRENGDFFGPLRSGARVGIVEEPQDSTGIVVRRTDAGLDVDLSHWLALRRPHVVLAMTPSKAVEVLDITIEDDGTRFWDILKIMSRGGGVEVYRFASQSKLEELGLAPFLASFDIRLPEDEGTDSAAR